MRRLTSKRQATIAIFVISCLWPVWLFGQTSAPVRAMTWNIAAGHGDLSQIADVIRTARPDIVGLQEVDVHWGDRSGLADQAARLGDAVGMEVRFGAIYRLAGEGTAPMREFGLAILSRLPILEFRNHEIPRLSTQSADTAPRSMPGFLEAVVQVGPARVRVFNTHLDYRADPRVRALQVAAMLERLADLAGPTLLLGDLNAPPAAAELAPLFRRLTDLWRNGGDPGFTYPADAPIRRIDYILTSDHFRALDVRVLPVQASDHRPVVADVSTAR
jgi:endonuclease/exonuclease/phosphatase family metal-dependent hydrolase